MTYSRRKFVYHTGVAAFGTSLFASACKSDQSKAEQHSESGSSKASSDLFFSISLAEWSLHKALFAEEMTNLDFAKVAREVYDVDGIEYVSAFFNSKCEDKAYLDELNLRATDHNLKQLLIMVDGEGPLASTDDAKRLESVENHYKWVKAAKHLGCHSIRVNSFGEGSPAEVKAAAIDGLGRLATFAKDYDINVIVENHGGLSSNGAWLASVMSEANMPNLGTLPDFGNFCIKRDGEGPWDGDCIDEYDRYKGIEELMPYAKGLSAKSHDFGTDGNEIHTDFSRMLQIAKDSGYRGFVGIEYEGEELSEKEGILATKALLIKAGQSLS